MTNQITQNYPSIYQRLREQGYPAVYAWLAGKIGVDDSDVIDGVMRARQLSISCYVSRQHSHRVMWYVEPYSPAFAALVAASHSLGQ